jgi:hypothetical protein
MYDGVEQVVGFNPINEIQGRLGVDEAVAQDLASIFVTCPIPGTERQTSLADFMASPHGQEKADQILDLASKAIREGATLEQSIERALGFSAVPDPETGKLARIDVAPHEATNKEPAVSKKK